MHETSCSQNKIKTRLIVLWESFKLLSFNKYYFCGYTKIFTIRRQCIHRMIGCYFLKCVKIRCYSKKKVFWTFRSYFVDVLSTHCIGHIAINLLLFIYTQQFHNFHKLSEQNCTCQLMFCFWLPFVNFLCTNLLCLQFTQYE